MQPPHSGGGTTEYHCKGGLLLDLERLLGLIAASLPLALMGPVRLAAGVRKLGSRFAIRRMAASSLRRAVVQTERRRVRMRTNRLAKTSDEPQLHSSRQGRSYHIYIILSERGFHLCGIPSIPIRHPGQRCQRLL